MAGVERLPGELRYGYLCRRAFLERGGYWCPENRSDSRGLLWTTERAWSSKTVDRDRLFSRALRYCPICAEGSYLPTIHQARWLTRCELHDVALSVGCMHCGQLIHHDLQPLRGRPFECYACKRPWHGGCTALLDESAVGELDSHSHAAVEAAVHVVQQVWSIGAVNDERLHVRMRHGKGHRPPVVACARGDGGGDDQRSRDAYGAVLERIARRLRQRDVVLSERCAGDDLKGSVFMGNEAMARELLAVAHFRVLVEHWLGPRRATLQTDLDPLDVMEGDVLRWFMCVYAALWEAAHADELDAIDYVNARVAASAAARRCLHEHSADVFVLLGATGLWHELELFTG